MALLNMVPSLNTMKNLVKAGPMTTIGVASVLSNVALKMLHHAKPLNALTFSLGKEIYKVLRNEVKGFHRNPLSFREIVEKRQIFDFEIHEVVTEDGYILEIHRIRHKAEYSDHAEPRPVMFMQHGLKCSSADWILGEELAFKMATHGFDVWMGNFRGNAFSKRHEYLTPDMAEFWNFSWDEHGTIDLPTMLDKVKEVTNCSRMYYIGHSMGTTAFFVMMNIFPQRNNDIIHCIALAPVTTVSDMQGMPSWFIPTTELMIDGMKKIGIHSMDFNKHMTCYSAIASLIVYVIGYHHINLDDAQKIIVYSPSGCSSLTVKHYIQCYNSGRFESRNQDSYSLDFVKCPVDIYWSPDDWASGKLAASNIASSLPNVKVCQEVTWKKFGHLDFLWSKCEEKPLYLEILRNIDHFEK